MKEDNIHELFFELIRVAIGNAVCLSHTPTDVEWKVLYEMAKKQSLVGICFAGIQKLEPSETLELSETLRLRWMGMAAKIQQRNEVVNRQCAELGEMFLRYSGCSGEQARKKLKDYRYAVLKGQGVAQLYDEPLRALRQSGDIDVYLWRDGLTPRENRKAVLEYAKTIDKDTFGSAHHTAVRIYPDSEVELHYEASYMCNPWANRRLQVWMREKRTEVEMLKTKEGEFDVPSIEFNLVFLLAHIFRHYVSEGVGMRQVMDYYFALQAAQVKGYSLEVKGDLFSLLDSFNMKKFASAVMWVIKTVFAGHDNYDDNDNWMLCEPNERLGRKLLEHIMQGGNFGHHNAVKVVKSGAHWANFVNQLAHDLHLAYDYPAEALWSPISMIKEFLRIRI